MTVHFYRDIIYVKWNNKLEFVDLANLNFLNDKKF